MIQTNGLLKYAYPGNPSTLVSVELDEWIANVLAGKIPSYDPSP
jgi:hypothetical protein